MKIKSKSNSNSNSFLPAFRPPRSTLQGTRINGMQPVNTFRFGLSDRIKDAEVGLTHEQLALPGFEGTQKGWDAAAFDEMVRKGTQAWAGVPDDWLENLRASDES